MAMCLVVPTTINSQQRVSAASLSEAIMSPDFEREIVGREPERFDDPDVRVYSTATLDDNFCASSIIVVKKSSHSQITTQSTSQNSILRQDSALRQ